MAPILDFIWRKQRNNNSDNNVLKKTKSIQGTTKAVSVSPNTSLILSPNKSSPTILLQSLRCQGQLNIAQQQQQQESPPGIMPSETCETNETTSPSPSKEEEDEDEYGNENMSSNDTTFLTASDGLFFTPLHPKKVNMQQDASSSLVSPPTPEALRPRKSICQIRHELNLPQPAVKVTNSNDAMPPLLRQESQYSTTNMMRQQQQQQQLMFLPPLPPTYYYPPPYRTQPLPPSQLPVEQHQQQQHSVTYVSNHQPTYVLMQQSPTPIMGGGGSIGGGRPVQQQQQYYTTQFMPIQQTYSSSSRTQSTRIAESPDLSIGNAKTAVGALIGTTTKDNKKPGPLLVEGQGGMVLEEEVSLPPLPILSPDEKDEEEVKKYNNVVYADEVSLNTTRTNNNNDDDDDDDSSSKLPVAPPYQRLDDEYDNESFHSGLQDAPSSIHQVPEESTTIATTSSPTLWKHYEQHVDESYEHYDCIEEQQERYNAKQRQRQGQQRKKKQYQQYPRDKYDVNVSFSSRVGLVESLIGSNNNDNKTRRDKNNSTTTDVSFGNNNNNNTGLGVYNFEPIHGGIVVADIETNDAVNVSAISIGTAKAGVAPPSYQPPPDFHSIHNQQREQQEQQQFHCDEDEERSYGESSVVLDEREEAWDNALLKQKNKNQRKSKENTLLTLIQRLQDDVRLVRDVDDIVDEGNYDNNNDDFDDDLSFITRTQLDSDGLLCGYSKEKRQVLLTNISRVLSEIDNMEDNGGIVKSTDYFLSSPPPASQSSAQYDDEEESNSHEELRLSLKFLQSIIKQAIPCHERNNAANTTGNKKSKSIRSNQQQWKASNWLRSRLGLDADEEQDGKSNIILPASPGNTSSKILRGGDTDLFSLPCESQATPHTSNVSMTSSITTKPSRTYDQYYNNNKNNNTLLLHQYQNSTEIVEDKSALLKTIKIISSLLQKLTLSCNVLIYMDVISAGGSEEDQQHEESVIAANEIKRRYKHLMSMNSSVMMSLIDSFVLIQEQQQEDKVEEKRYLQAIQSRNTISRIISTDSQDHGNDNNNSSKGMVEASPAVNESMTSSQIQRGMIEASPETDESMTSSQIRRGMVEATPPSEVNESMTSSQRRGMVEATPPSEVNESMASSQFRERNNQAIITNCSRRTYISNNGTNNDFTLPTSEDMNSIQSRDDAHLLSNNDNGSPRDERDDDIGNDDVSGADDTRRNYYFIDDLRRDIGSFDNNEKERCEYDDVGEHRDDSEEREESIILEENEIEVKQITRGWNDNNTINNANTNNAEEWLRGEEPTIRTTFNIEKRY